MESPFNGQLIQKMNRMTFSQAFERLNQSPVACAMRLPFWNPNTEVAIQMPDSGSANTHPYLYVLSDNGRVPWIPTYPELFSEEWEVRDVTTRTV